MTPLEIILTIVLGIILIGYLWRAVAGDEYSICKAISAVNPEMNLVDVDTGSKTAIFTNQQFLAHGSRTNRVILGLQIQLNGLKADFSRATDERDKLQMECDSRKASYAQKKQLVADLRKQLEEKTAEAEEYKRQFAAGESYRTRSAQDLANRTSEISKLREELETIRKQVADREKSELAAKPFAVGERVKHVLGGPEMVIVSIDKQLATCEKFEGGKLTSQKLRLSSLKRVTEEKLPAPRHTGGIVTTRPSIVINGEELKLGLHDSIVIERKPYGPYTMFDRPFGPR